MRKPQTLLWLLTALSVLLLSLPWLSKDRTKYYYRECYF